MHLRAPRDYCLLHLDFRYFHCYFLIFLNLTAVILSHPFEQVVNQKHNFHHELLIKLEKNMCTQEKCFSECVRFSEFFNNFCRLIMYVDVHVTIVVVSHPIHPSPTPG